MQGCKVHFTFTVMISAGGDGVGKFLVSSGVPSHNSGVCCCISLHSTSLLCVAL